MRTVKEIDEAASELRAQIQTWEQDVATKQADLKGLEGEKAGHRRKALRDKDASAMGSLDAVRSVTFWLVQEISDYEAEIAKATQELAELQIERAAALAEEAWEGFMTLGKEVVKEAGEIERHLTEFIELSSAHAAKLEKMDSLAKAAGYSSKVASDKHLHRRFFALMHKADPRSWTRQNQAYDEPLPKLLQRLFANADAQRSGRSERVAVNE